MRVSSVKAEDIKTINEWYKGWGCPEIPLHALPKGGFIVPGLAAGFLYLTDSSIGIIEGLVSNPETTPKDRDLALDEVTKAIMGYASRQECSLVVAYATREEVGDRAAKHGFKPMGAFLGYVKEVRKWDS